MDSFFSLPLMPLSEPSRSLRAPRSNPDHDFLIAVSLPPRFWLRLGAHERETPVYEGRREAT